MIAGLALLITGCAGEPEDGTSSEPSIAARPGVATVTWARSAGGWRIGSAIDPAQTWTDSTGSTDPLETLTQAPSSLSDYNATDTWGKVGNWPVSTKLSICQSGSTDPLCTTLSASPVSQVFSVKEEDSAGGWLEDNQSRGVARTLTGLGGGKWKLSFDSWCALTDPTTFASVGACAGTSSSAATGAVHLGIFCNAAVNLSGWTEPDILHLNVPMARARTRVEAEFYLPASCSANNNKAALVAWVSNDVDIFKDRVGDASPPPWKQSLSTNYWRSTLLDKVRLEKVYLDDTAAPAVSESKKGLADYKQILTKAGLTISPDPDGTFTRTATISNIQRTATYREVWHPPARVTNSSSQDPAAEGGTGLYFAVPTRPDETRPWTVPTSTEASRGSSQSDPLLMESQSSGNDVARRWIAVRNPPGSSDLAWSSLTFTLPSSDWRLYAVVQEPVMVKWPFNLTPTPLSSSETSFEVLYKIVPMFLSRCTGTGATVQCGNSTYGGWGIDQGATRMYVLEAPLNAGAQGPYSLQVQGPSNTATLWAQVYSISSTSNPTNLVWGMSPEGIAAASISEVASVFTRHGVNELALGTYLSQAAPDMTKLNGTATWTFNGHSYPISVYFNGGGDAAGATAPALADGLTDTNLGAVISGGSELITLPEDPTQYVTGVTYSTTTYTLAQSAAQNPTYVDHLSGAVFAGKVTCPGSSCAGGSGANQWVPKPGDYVTCRQTWDNTSASFGRIAAVSGNTLYLDVPLSSSICSGMTKLYRVVHWQDLNARDTGANDLFDQIPVVDAANPPVQFTTTVDGGTTRVVGGAVCPPMASIRKEIANQAPERDYYYPPTCQRPMVDYMGLTGDGKIKLRCWKADTAPPSVDPQACHLWQQFNAAQRGLVDTIVDAYLDLMENAYCDTAQSCTTQSRPPIFRMPWQYDETYVWNSNPDGMFDGFGMSELLDLASRFEGKNARTTNSSTDAYFVDWEYQDSVGGLNRMTWPTTPYSNYSLKNGYVADQNANQYLCPNGVCTQTINNVTTTVNELFYHGAYPWGVQSPLMARKRAGLGASRVEYDAGTPPNRGTIIWNLMSGFDTGGLFTDPAYVTGCTGTSPDKMTYCYAAYRDLLDFGLDGFNKEHPLPFMLPGQGSAAVANIDSSYEESVAFSMMLEGRHDLKRADDHNVSNLLIAAHVTYDIVETGYQSVCSLMYLASGVVVQTPGQFCGDFLCTTASDCPSGYSSCDTATSTCN